MFYPIMSLFRSSKESNLENGFTPREIQKIKEICPECYDLYVSLNESLKECDEIKNVRRKRIFYSSVGLIGLGVLTYTTYNLYFS